MSTCFVLLEFKMFMLKILEDSYAILANIQRQKHSYTRTMGIIIRTYVCLSFVKWITYSWQLCFVQPTFSIIPLNQPKLFKLWVNIVCAVVQQSVACYLPGCLSKILQSTYMGSHDGVSTYRGIALTCNKLRFKAIIQRWLDFAKPLSYLLNISLRTPM